MARKYNCPLREGKFFITITHLLHAYHQELMEVTGKGFSKENDVLNLVLYTPGGRRIGREHWMSWSRNAFEFIKYDRRRVLGHSVENSRGVLKLRVEIT